MSQVGRRLAQKTSALGLAGTLALFVCSIFIIATPGTASAAVDEDFTYSCPGSLLNPSNESITVKLSAPNTVTAGATFDLTVNIPALTLETAPQAATTVQVNAPLTPTGATVQDPGVKPGASVTANNTAVPAKSVIYKVNVPATPTTGTVTIKPGTITLSLASPTSATATCTTTSTASLSVPIGTGGGGNTDTDVVEYSCDVPSTSTDTSYEAIKPEIKVVLTPPTSASANADASVTWAGTIQTTGDQLKLPTGFPTTGAKMFATIKGSGAGVPATATGEAAITAPTAGSPLTTLPSVTIKIKPTTTGEVTLTAGDLAFGTSATAPALKCTAPTTGLKQFKFTVGNATTSPSPTTTTPRPTTTHTATVTVTPSTTRSSSTPTKKSQTPKAGADTGAGGMAGPDGRLFILTGTALVAAAAVGGLVMRRRSIRS
ncbi:hypothetical protein AB0K12_00780 [Nonomuraea sp. NPDC049419]|uniref:hypothetical protein n=1 Tax=Nonomuraea sp. NPDC049419 TaxID=3155772 RepID=UPI00342F5817